MQDDVLDGDIMLPAQSQELSPMVAAEINQQVATAKRYPRRPDKAIAAEIMSRATLNEEMASECMYSLSRGGKHITGPSIRFAEIIRASFGNIRVATRFVGIDMSDPDRQGVIVEAVCMDMQTNQGEVVFERRSIMTSGKNGKKPVPYGADMTATAISAARSIARRNAIIAVVPKNIWIEGYHQVVKVLQGEANTLQKRRDAAMLAFDKIGVARELVLAALEVKTLDDVTVEHMPQLIGFYTAIKDGEAPASVLGRADVAATIEHAKVSNPLNDPVTPRATPKADSVVDKSEPDKHSDDDVPPSDVPPLDDRPPFEPDHPKYKPSDPPKEAAKEHANEIAKLEAKAEPKAEKKADPKPEKKVGPKAAAKPDEVLPGIKTPEQYLTHIEAWLPTVETSAGVAARWGAERPCRQRVGVMEDMLEKVGGLKDARFSELKAAGK